jgi:uncharacterized cupredoxin-like copper-binding protein
VAEYAYLVGIAVVAVGVGAAALLFARSEMGSAAPLAAGRVVLVTTTDTLRFAPSELSVRVGETIAFEITNPGAVPHEFFIGTAAEQAEHEAEMLTGAPMHAEPGQVDVPPGQTVRLVYTFQEAGTLEYGCHVPGHYGAGMRGLINVL